MPIYEYKCGKCGEISEFIVFGNDEALHCKSCNSDNLEKLLSAHNTSTSSRSYTADSPGGCCGSPNSCGNPGSCCAG